MIFRAFLVAAIEQSIPFCGLLFLNIPRIARIAPISVAERVVEAIIPNFALYGSWIEELSIQSAYNKSQNEKIKRNHTRITMIVDASNHLAATLKPVLTFSSFQNIHLFGFSFRPTWEGLVVSTFT